MGTGGCRASWRRTSAIRASSIASWATSSTRAGATPPSARLRELLGRYFDGDGSQLATLLDPTRRGSPLYQFRTEMSDEFRRLNERLEALEDARRARAEERARGTAKGADFEAALEERLGALAQGLGDLVERTGTDGGDAMTSKKGDLVITIDPTRTRGTSLRIVVEAKDRPMPLGRMTKELAEARVNRSAAIAMAVFTPHTAPTAVDTAGPRRTGRLRDLRPGDR